MEHDKDAGVLRFTIQEKVLLGCDEIEPEDAVIMLSIYAYGRRDGSLTRINELRQEPYASEYSRLKFEVARNQQLTALIRELSKVGQGVAPKLFPTHTA